MKLRARWAGGAPATGDLLWAGPRARGAYVIRGAQRIAPSHLILDVDKITLEQLAALAGAGAAIHRWQWDVRGRRGRTRKE